MAFGLVRWGLLSAVLLGGCGPAQHESLEVGGVETRLVSRSERAVRPGGVVVGPGDYVIEAGDLRVVVAGMRRGDDVAGSIIEATLADATAEDSIVGVAPRLSVGQRSYAVRAREMYVLERDGKPVLRIDGVAHVGNRAVEVSRELAVVSFGTGLSMTTRAVPADGEPLAQVRSAMRVGWGGGAPFVPGVGRVTDDAWHDANWIGREGADLSTVVAYGGTPMRARAVFERHGSVSFLAHTDIASPRHDLEAGQVLQERSGLILARGGLGEAVRRLGWARGSPFPEVLVTLPYSPAGARVMVRTAAGRPMIETRPNARGQALVPLFPVSTGEPSSRHVLQATAAGHAPGETVTVRSLERQRLVLPLPRGGRIMVRAVDADTGRRIAARVRIRGLGGTPQLDLGPEGSAAGAVDTVVTLAGAVEIPAPPGTYRVIVTRGPEWTILDQTVEVTETFRPEVDAALRHVVRPGPWIAGDFHLHASPSPDSQVSLADRVAALVAEGIRFAVPTDHNHVTDYGPTVVVLGVTDFGTVTGVEVTTWDPVFGHFNAYPFPLDPSLPGNGAPVWEHTSPGELFAALHALDPEIVVQVNHPRMEPGIGYFEIMGLDPETGSAADTYSPDFDLLEVWNGFDLNRMEMFERVFTDWLVLVEHGRHVTAVGNSDSHRVRFQWAGYPRTYVRVPGGDFSDPRSVVRALRAGHAFVTSGPFLEVWAEGRGPGDTVTVEPGLLGIHVRVRAPPWMSVDRIDVYYGRTIVQTIPIVPPEPPPSTRPRAENRPVPPAVPDVVRASLDIKVDVREPGFLVVVARGERPMDDLLARPGIPPLAFTNPIWVELVRHDADGGAGDAGPSAGPDAGRADAGRLDAGAAGNTEAPATSP